MLARRLRAQRDGRERVRADVEGEDLQHADRQWESTARQRPDHERCQLGDVVGQVVREEAAQVPERGPPLFDRGDDRGEVVVEQDEVGCLARDVGSAPSHRDTDVRFMEGRRVVHAVPRHRHDMSTMPQGSRDPELLFGSDAGQHDPVTVDERAEDGVVLRKVAALDDECVVRRAGRPRAQSRAPSPDDRP